MFLIKYADEHITDGIKIYPNKLNNIKDKLISEGIDFYKDFCICKNIVIVYKHIPITQSNKITKYLLSIIDTNYKIYYSTFFLNFLYLLLLISCFLVIFS